jgi:hypothetical protein
MKKKTFHWAYFEISSKESVPGMASEMASLSGVKVFTEISSSRGTFGIC